MSKKHPRKLHVFAGSFTNRQKACLYTEEQWQPEPDESEPDEVHQEWEERNPVWGLADDLEIGLDSDFIETIDGTNRIEYLAGYLTNDDDINAVRKIIGDKNILVLIFPEALHDRNSKFKSTPKMVYCGSFDFDWN